MKYRTRLAIVADILTVAMQKQKKTRIMYSGNLSFKLINSYLKLLTESHLLTFDSSNNFYFVSDKGKRFLSLFRDYKLHVCKVEKKLEKIEDTKNQLNNMCIRVGIIKN